LLPIARKIFEARADADNGFFRNTNDSGFRTAFLMIVFPDEPAFVIILIAGFLAIVTASSAVVKNAAS
jgi:hypothetical protein